MSYKGKTDWKLNDMVYPEDMNRIEGQIEKNTSEIEGVSGKIGTSSDGEEQLTLFGKLAAILAKILGIDTKVGTSDDAKTKPTLFGKIAGIGDTLSENLTPVTEKITEVLAKVSGIDTNVKTVLNGVGYVKSTDGRKYAAIMEVITNPLKTVKKGGTTFIGTYSGVAYDDKHFYVSTNSTLYKVSRETLEVVKSMSFKDPVFGCDENYIYVGGYQVVKKLDKNTFEQVASSDFNLKYTGMYDCNILRGSYVFTTNLYGVHYTKFDKSSFNILKYTSMGDSGKGRISGNSKYIVCSPANVYRAPMDNLDNSSLFVGSLSFSDVMSIICDENHAYILGRSKIQKYDIETLKLVKEDSIPVSVSDGLNFDCQNDDFLFLVPASGGKMKKISKSTLEVITESEENVSKVFFADNDYVYCATSDNVPSKIAVVAESGNFNITGFKEV